MVRMDRWQPIAFQLLADDVNEALHTRVVVGPIANDLQTVGQVAVRVRKVGFQFQRRAIRLDGFRDIAGILHGSETPIHVSTNVARQIGRVNRCIRPCESKPNCCGRRQRPG